MKEIVSTSPGNFPIVFYPRRILTPNQHKKQNKKRCQRYDHNKGSMFSFCICVDVIISFVGNILNVVTFSRFLRIRWLWMPQKAFFEPILLVRVSSCSKEVSSKFESSLVRVNVRKNSGLSNYTFNCCSQIPVMLTFR